MNILSILEKEIDNDYKKFHEKLCHSKYEILGIRIPILRNICKELLKKYNYIDILNNLENNYYEEIMLEGLIICNSKTNFEEKIKLVNNFIPKIDNWAICDIFCSELKVVNKYKKEFLDFVKTYLESNNEYYLRFGIVILLNYYINDEYIDNVLNKLLTIKSDYYYVKMAYAWCLSICLIKYFDRTIKFMDDNQNKIDIWTYNKALQKGIESFRINKDNKEILKNMKR